MKKKNTSRMFWNDDWWLVRRFTICHIVHLKLQIQNNHLPKSTLSSRLLLFYRCLDVEITPWKCFWFPDTDCIPQLNHICSLWRKISNTSSQNTVRFKMYVCIRNILCSIVIIVYDQLKIKPLYVHHSEGHVVSPSATLSLINDLIGFSDKQSTQRN